MYVAKWIHYSSTIHQDPSLDMLWCYNMNKRCCLLSCLGSRASGCRLAVFTFSLSMLVNLVQRAYLEVDPTGLYKNMFGDQQIPTWCAYVHLPLPIEVIMSTTDTLNEWNHYARVEWWRDGGCLVDFTAYLVCVCDHASVKLSSWILIKGTGLSSHRETIDC